MSGALPEDLRQRTLEKLFPEPNPYVNDPVRWAKDKLGIWLWSKQREILGSIVQNRYTAVHSCHGSGKSIDAAVASCWWLDVHPLGDAFVVTTAPTAPQVKAILWRYMARFHRKAKLPGRINLAQEWYMGQRTKDEEMIAYGRKPQDYDDQAFQGIHARYVLVIADEACGIPKSLYDAIDTLVTNEESRVLAIGNPDDPSAHFEQICRPGSGWTVISIDAFETPNFTGEPVPEDVAKQLVSKQWVEERAKRWGVGSPLYVSKVRGRFPEISDGTLIPPAWVRRAQENEIETRSLGRYGADIARFGTDETCLYRNRDGKVRLIEAAHKQDTMKTTGMIAKVLNEHGLDLPEVVVDVIGVGAGVVDRLYEMGYNVAAFDASGESSNPRRFRNRRAEAYWALREQFEYGNMDIDPGDEDLASQLGSIRYWIDSWGRINIESKDQMKKRGLPSPDRADAVMMCTTGKAAGYAEIVVVGDSLTGDLLTRRM